MAPENEVRRDFQDLLTDLDDGDLHRRLTEDFPELVKRCVETNQPGAITITLKIKPRGNGSNVDVISSHTVKAPSAKINPTLFFTDEDGNLSRYKPITSQAEQQPLRSVDTNPPIKLRTAGTKEE